MSDRTVSPPDVARSSPAAGPHDRGQSTTGSTGSGGRPSARASGLLAGAVGLLAVLGIGVATGAAPQAVVVVVAGLGFAGGTSLLSDRDPVRVAAGTASSVLSACGIVAAVVPAYPFAMAALALGAFGAAATPIGSVGDDRLTDAAGALVYAIVPIGVVAALAIAVRLLGPVTEVTNELISPTSIGANLTGFAVVLVAAAGGCLLALRSLPVVRLAPKPERDRIRERYDRLLSVVRSVTWVAVALVPVAVVGWALLQSDPQLQSSVGPLAGLTGSSLVRIPLALAAAVGFAVYASVTVLRWAGGSVVDLTRRGTAAAVGLVLAVVAVPLAGPVYAAGLERLSPDVVSVLREFGASIGPVATVLLGALMTVVTFVMALLVLPAVVGLGLAPDRTAAPAFGATGLLVGSALVVDHVAAPIVFAGVVAGMVVWDLGEYGVGIAEELDEASATRAEAVHAAGTLGVGTLVLAGAVGVHALIADVSLKGSTALAGLAVAFVGIVLLAAVLRG